LVVVVRRFKNAAEAKSKGGTERYGGEADGKVDEQSHDGLLSPLLQIVLCLFVKIVHFRLCHLRPGLVEPTFCVGAQSDEG
jgi:hypothetical protein